MTQCLCITKKGTRCSRNATISGLCKQHENCITLINQKQHKEQIKQKQQKEQIKEQIKRIKQQKEQIKQQIKRIKQQEQQQEQQQQKEEVKFKEIGSGTSGCIYRPTLPCKYLKMYNRDIGHLESLWEYN